MTLLHCLFVVILLLGLGGLVVIKFNKIREQTKNDPAKLWIILAVFGLLGILSVQFIEVMLIGPPPETGEKIEVISEIGFLKFIREKLLVSQIDELIGKEDYDGDGYVDVQELRLGWDPFVYTKAYPFKADGDFRDDIFESSWPPELPSDCKWISSSFPSGNFMPNLPDGMYLIIARQDTALENDKRIIEEIVAGKLISFEVKEGKFHSPDFPSVPVSDVYLSSSSETEVAIARREN